MRLQIHNQRRPFLFKTLGATAALLAASPVLAQNNNNGNNNNNNNNDDQDEDTEDPSSTGNNNNNNRPEPTDNNNDPEPTEPPADNNDENEDPASTSTTETQEEAESETSTTATSEEEAEETEQSSSTTMTEEEATTTTTNDAEETGNDPDITASLTRGFGIPTYPAAAVPPTFGAPFMEHSRAPDGTVFIIVGAILGAFGLGILLWRVIVGLLLHRSVERAARAQHDANGKTGFPAPPAPFYKYTDQGSNMSLGGGGTAGRGTRRTNRGPIPSSNPSMSNLFFSPTAAASNNGGNRGSTLLPSGFYAANSGSVNTQHGHSISLTNLRPDSRGQGTARSGQGITPPDSPAFPARRDLSASSLNLHRPSSQRAPSAYLDDLLADDPGALPPPHMPPSNGPRQSNLGPNSNRL